jgi:hypothetical protein
MMNAAALAADQAPVETRIDFDPQVGDRVHVCFWTDVEPATVIKRTPSFCVVRIDKAERDPSWQPNIIPGGFAGHCENNNQQRWVFSEDLAGRTMKFSDRGFKHTHWSSATGETFERVWRQGPGKRGLRLGAGWRKFHDYNF